MKVQLGVAEKQFCEGVFVFGLRITQQRGVKGASNPARGMKLKGLAYMTQQGV